MSLTHYFLVFLLGVVFSAVPLDADPDKHPGEAVTVQAVEEQGYYKTPHHYKPPYYRGPPHYKHPPVEEAVGEEALAKLPFPKPPIFHLPPKFKNLPPYLKRRFPKAPYPKPPPPHYYKPSVGSGTP